MSRRNSARVQAAIASAKRAPARTLIDPSIACGLQLPDEEPLGCLRWRGRERCGPTSRVRITVKGCKPVDVEALITPIEPSILGPVVIGRDVLRHCSRASRRKS